MVGESALAATRRLGVVFVLSVLMASVPPTGAQQSTLLTAEERDYVRDHGPIIVAVNDGFAPFVLFDDRGVAQGINPDFLRLMSIRLGVQFEFVREKNFSATLDAVNTGRADMTGNLALNPERQLTMVFTEPYVWMNIVFWTREGYSLRSDLAGETIAMVTRTGTIATIKEKYPLAIILEVSDVRDGLRALQNGTVTAAVGATAPTSFIIREEKFFNITPVGTPITQNVYRFAITKDEPRLVDIINKGLASITPDERTTIFQKWTGTDLGEPTEPVTGIPMAAQRALAGAAIVIVLIGAWVFILRRQVAARTRDLRGSQERFELAVGGARDGIWDIDLSPPGARAHPAYFSPRINEIIGLPRSSTIGRNDFEARIHPEDALAASLAMASHLAHETPRYESEYRLRCEDGAWKWISSRGKALRRGDGTAYRVTGSLTDITERKLTEAALWQSNADLKQFAYVASHDLQAPLRHVSGYAELIEQRYARVLDDKGRTHIRYVREGVERMQRLIDDLLAYSRVDRAERAARVTDAGRACAAAIRVLAPMIRETHAEVDVAPLPSVLADEVQLQQVFQHIIENSIKFRAKRPLRIRVTAEQSDAEVVFHIEDNGRGFDAKHKDRIFEIFQRLETPAQDTSSGMGLAITKKIIERCGGRIWAESETDKGTTMRFALPRGAPAPREGT